jgi:two-component system sensor kinase
MSTTDTHTKAEEAVASQAAIRGDRRESVSARFKWTTACAIYMLLAFPLHFAFFIMVVIFWAVGVPLTILWVGFPLLYAAVMLARTLAVVQRRVNRAFAGDRTPRSVLSFFDREEAYNGFAYPAPEGVDRFRRLLYPLRDLQSWLDITWVVTSFPITVFNWCVTFTWTVTVPLALSAPISIPILESLPGAWYNGIGGLLRIPHPMVFDIVLFFLGGLVMLVAAPSVLQGLARLQFVYADLLLSRRARNRADIERLTQSRAAARKAESAALRKLERDLHDGPQQRLVRLNMDLARAKRQAGSDPVKTQAILEEAMVQTQDTLAELRQLSRGIAPPVLVDRGLAAAVAEVAARSAVPVTVHADVPEIPDHVASAAYYVVAEALVNVNKHAGAGSADVVVGVRDGYLRVTVVDDGEGGADRSKGHGLAGLEERLKSVDGALAIASPQGGPTVVKAVIPCAS